MKTEKTASIKTVSLIEELSDEALAACVGGTGYARYDGQPIGNDVDDDDLEDTNTYYWNPNGSVRFRK